MVICENVSVSRLSTLTKNLTITVIAFFMASAVAQAMIFPDVPGSHPHAEAIDFLSEENILGGYPDGTFRPEQLVNRAEALKILLLAGGIDVSGVTQSNFSDVPSSAWFAPFVSVARSHGITDGYPDGLFRPEQTVNLVEALKMLLVTNKIDLGNYATNKKLFSDSVPQAWYNSFLAYAQKFDIVQPDAINNIFPDRSLTREVLAEIVYRFVTRVDRVCPRFFENIKLTPFDYFEGVLLSNEMPNVFYENETFLIAGSVLDDATNTTVFFVDSNGVQTSFSDETENGSFTIPIEFRAPGIYHFSVLPSLSGRSFAANIEVLPRECAPAEIDFSSTSPSSLYFSTEENMPVLQWQNVNTNLARVVIRQQDHRFERLLSAGQNSLTLSPSDFEGWQKGVASVQIFGAKSEHGFSYEPRTQWSVGASLDFTVGQHYFSKFHHEELELAELPITRSNTFSLSGVAKTTLEPTAYLITPSGLVEEVVILKDAEEIVVNSSFEAELKMQEEGTYIVEINDTSGLPVLNHPIYNPDIIPLLPDFADLRERVNNQKLSVNRERAIWLRLINGFRAHFRLSAVKIDDSLTELAQAYAERMATEDFFGHIDPDGNDPEVRRREFSIPLPVGENLARDTKTEYAHEGLLRSATHRLNILTPEWSYVGLGIARNKKGEILFVQEFSATPLTSENLTDFKKELLDFVNDVREKNNLANLITSSALEIVAQNWSEKMLTEEFLAFEEGNAKLEDDIRATNYNGSFSSFIVSSGRLVSLAESLEDEEGWLDLAKNHVAIGLTQGNDGLFRAVFIFH